MKLSELLQTRSFKSLLDLDINSEEFIQKYFTDIEKTTNGLLTPSKLIGTLLALCSTGFKNPKIACDVAEKLLK